MYTCFVVVLVVAVAGAAAVVVLLYQVPGTQYLVPSPWYQVIAIKCFPVQGVIGTTYLVPSTWYQVLGTKYSIVHKYII